jgi:parallel beta-helix repeat protein
VRVRLLDRERRTCGGEKSRPGEVAAQRFEALASPGHNAKCAVRLKHFECWALAPLTLIFVSLLSISAPAQRAASERVPEVPGPSQALHAAPFYSCLRNFYVSPNGSNSNPGTEEQPWQTIQRADTPSRLGGDCINVAAGIYRANVLVRHGGSEPTPTGYVVYRCQVLGACRVLAPRDGHLWGFRNNGNFVVVDGFEVDGNDALLPGGIADTCFGTDDQTYGPGNSTHHIWLINNTVHHCNLSGISLAWKEWYYVIHNAVYQNSFTSGWQGSGISLVVVQCIEHDNPSCHSGSAYIPSGMDLSFARSFHIVVSWNDVHDNTLSRSNPVPCGSHSDGNGIIMDTFFDGATNKVAYPYRSLVLGNVSYSNGGRGIHLFRASNITVTNNTVYGNGRDNCLNAYALGDLSQQGGSDNVWVNNISKSLLSAVNLGCGRYCGGRNAPIVSGDAAGVIDTNITWSNNVTYGGIGVMLFDNDAVAPYFSCHNNSCDVDPLLVDPASGNFALRPHSPAIGYGRSEGYLQPSLVDAGACTSSVATCP